jgi:hypothetical protein
VTIRPGSCKSNTRCACSTPASGPAALAARERTIICDPRATQRILDPPVAGFDHVGGNGADKGIERLCADRVGDALADPLRIKTRRGEALGQDCLVIRADLRSAHMIGWLRAPRAMFVLIGPGHSTVTPTLVPSSLCSSASDNDRATYLVIEYGPWFVPQRF